jgi:CheY-like chemotaxis protein
MSESPARVRVLVVDDDADIRTLLRLQLSSDPRFEIVGEAADGYDAIDRAAALQPDLVVLDKQMPRLGGIEAMPDIRRRAPNAAVVLYTAQTDPATYHAALDAGAVQVLDKLGVARGFAGQLVAALRRGAASADAGMEIHVGPVSSSAARVWIANTRKILAAVGAHPEILDEAVPRAVLDLFGSFLDQWEAVAATTDEFRWVARADPDDVLRVVGYWAAIDAMTDDQLRRLGIDWSPPDGAPFFTALTTGVVTALHRHEETQRLAARLGEQWAPYMTRG